ncbi:SprT-like domain-containing protein [Microbacterium sp. NPDC057659]|uniref:SprT-like domain-containing protein n=1 Tax=Microbacterium sp. NPDC057659 TaxID=3346198 RepID=UPI0036724C44
MADLKRVRVWAEALIDLHLDPSWSFDFDHAKRRAGACHYTTSTITVSRYLAARFEDDEIHQVLLHEVAHALAGPAAAHGRDWKRIADDLGYVGGTTHHGETATELAPWVGRCPSGHLVYRHRRPARAISCAKCSRTYDPRFAFAWTHREITPAARLAAQTPR